MYDSKHVREQNEISPLSLSLFLSSSFFVYIDARSAHVSAVV